MAILPRHYPLLDLTVVDINTAKKARGTYRTAQLVLQAYDDQEHAVKREVLDLKAEAQIKARERL